MGTWGSGNLESDGALDAKGERSDELIKRIWTKMQSSSSWEADELDHDYLFLEIEWLLALEDAELFNGWNLPPVEDFDSAVETWLDGWSDYFDGLAGPEFKAERRGVIEETFTKLRAVCEKYEQLRDS